MNTFFIRQNSILKKVSYDSVLWIKAEGNYSMLHTDTERYVLKLSLKQILAQLPAKRFFQIHRSYIVNLQKVEDIEVSNNNLTISGHKLPMGKSYKKILLSTINIIK